MALVRDEKWSRACAEEAGGFGTWELMLFGRFWGVCMYLAF